MNPSLAISTRLFHVCPNLKLQTPDHSYNYFFSRLLSDSTTRFVGPSVRWSVRHTLLFLGFWGLWPYCSCPNDGVAEKKIKFFAMQSAQIHPL